MDLSLPHTTLSTQPLQAVAPALPTLRGVVGLAEWRIKSICAFAGSTLASLATLLLYRFAEPGQALHRMFDPTRTETLIPWSILLLYFYGTFYLAHRARRLAALRKVAHRGAATAVVEALGGHGVAALCAHFERSPCAGNPLWRRALAVLRQWQLQPGLSEAELALEHQVQADHDALQGIHATLATIVWALPVLGLIGTVLGIASAVDGFSGFLSGDIDDIRSIKQSLVVVTSGLSFAFLLTLLGLVTSLLLMFHNAAVQSRNERLFAELQDWISDLLLPALQRVQPATTPPPADTVSALPELATLWCAELKRSGALMIEAFGHELAAERRASAESSAEIGSALLQSAQTAGGGLHQAAQVARELVDVVRQSLHLDQQALAAIREAQLGPALHQVAVQVQAQCERTGQAAEQLATMAQATRTLTECHRGVQDGIHALEAMRLPGALAELGVALGRLQPVLEQFQRPFMLTAVPVPGTMPGQAQGAVAGARS